MGRYSKIQWTDHTANFWWGCYKIGAGCANCYAEAAARRWGRDVWGPDRARLFVQSVWSDVLRWNAAAAEAGRRDRVFVSSMSDFFEPDAPVVNGDAAPLYFAHDPTRPSVFPGKSVLTLAALRRAAFRLIDQCQNLDFLLLTKRPDAIRRAWLTAGDGETVHRLHVKSATIWRANVWLGVSASRQAEVDRLLPELAQCRDLAAGLFVSLEPLLEPIRLANGAGNRYQLPTRNEPWYVPVDWAIVGGESGPDARPCDPVWIRAIRAEGREYGFPVFTKQAGAQPVNWPGQALTDPKGGDADEWGDAFGTGDLRQFPAGLVPDVAPPAHRFDPFTTRDGGTACRQCDAPPHAHATDPPTD